jgi:hypothetical protein
MDVEESSGDLDAEPIPTAPCASEVSSDNFASTIDSMVGIQVVDNSEVPNEELVDYEASP